ncbi:MAG: sulfotransferase family protein [Gammaproteobacteria bacterium]|nr:sulfotransferase family protein [Gammaproteobacteria bacterium]
MPALVYLHIPKSAGSSHRNYLFDVYGKERVYWYGLNSDDLDFSYDAVAGYEAIGGHRPLDFYPRDFDALFTAVVRDPIKRAVSFFNYCIEPPVVVREEWRAKQRHHIQHWRDTGVDPESMLRSIEKSEELRNQISNYQCRYLSRYENTFEGVRQSLEENNFVVGLFDQIEKFNNFFQTDLAFPTGNRFLVNSAPPGYWRRISQEEGLIDALKELNQHDMALHNYIRVKNKGLYSRSRVNDLVERRVLEHCANMQEQTEWQSPTWGKVQLFSNGLIPFITSAPLTVSIVLSNRNESSIALTTTARRRQCIGWQLQDVNGKPILGACGFAHPKAVVEENQFQSISTTISLEGLHDLDPMPRAIEFCIVDGDNWQNQEYPLNSCWAKLEVPKSS